MTKQPNLPLFVAALVLIFCLTSTHSLIAANEQTVSVAPDSSSSDKSGESSENKTISEELELLKQIDRYNVDLEKMRKEILDLTGDQKNAQAILILETENQLRKTIGELLSILQNADSDEESQSEIIEKIKKILTNESSVIRNEISYVQENLAELKKDQGELDPLQLVARQQEINKNYLIFDELLDDLLKNALYMQAVGLSSSSDLALLDQLLKQRAIAVSSELKLIMGKLSDLKVQQSKASGSDQEKLKTEILAFEEEKKGASDSLADLIELMRARDIETTEYSELMIKATGQISSEILDSNVLFSLAEHGIEFVQDWVRENGIGLLIKFLFVILLLIIFKLVAGLVKRVVRKTICGDSSNMSQLMSNFIVSMSGKLVMLIGLLVALSQLGIKIAPLLAGLGIAGFIVGFALQDVLSNFASGVMILLYRPFDVGDTIEVPDVSGKVQHMNLVSTLILTYDNQKLVVPNNKIWGNIIRNVHSERIRRVDLTFGIGYEDDIDHAERVLREILEEHDLVLDQPEFTIKLHALNESSVDFIVRPWTKTENYWDVHWDVTRAVKERFDAEGISIPYPQRDVHLQEALPSAAS